MKDTVLVTCPVPGWSWHVEEDELGLWGLFDDDLIQPERCVHASHIGLVPEWRQMGSNCFTLIVVQIFDISKYVTKHFVILSCPKWQRSFTHNYSFFICSCDGHGQYEMWMDWMSFLRTSVLTGSPTRCSMARKERGKYWAMNVFSVNLFSN